MNGFILQLSHDISVACIIKEHVVELLDGLDLGPLALLDQLLVDRVVVDEEVVEAFVPVSNVPSNQTSRLHNSQQFGESLWHNGSREHASATEQHVIGVVLNRGWGVRCNISAYCPLIQTFFLRCRQKPRAWVKPINICVTMLIAQNKSDIAGSTCQIQDLGFLVCDALQQELLHQSLGVAVTHDRLTFVEVLQVRWPMVKELRPVVGIGGGAECKAIM